MKTFYQRFKAKHNIATDFDALIILVVFAVTGSLSLKVGKPVLDFFGIHKETMSPWAFWPLRILIIFPIYQLLQIAIGTTLGQFNFFWQFQKRMFAPIGRMRRNPGHKEADN